MAQRPRCAVPSPRCSSCGCDDGKEEKEEKEEREEERVGGWQEQAREAEGETWEGEALARETKVRNSFINLTEGTLHLYLGTTVNEVKETCEEAIDLNSWRREVRVDHLQVATYLW